MRVLKFGGTSVGTVESLLNVKNIVEGISEPCIVVVSALGGLTDKLIATAHMACGHDAWRNEMQAMEERHFNIIEKVVRPDVKSQVLSQVTTLLEDLRKNYEGIDLLGQLPDSAMDQVVSFGERLSAPIVAGMIEGAYLHYSPDFVKTERWFDKNIADVPLTDTLIHREFPDGSVSREVTGGFIASDRDSGAITNLGRGGSDYTAALIAAALDASVLDIWTDVDGFMTTDPRIVPTARVIPMMSFVESMDLCSFGAKVIYPPTIYPVFHKTIPIRILNTFNPSAPGTYICDRNSLPESAFEVPVRGISAIKQMALIHLKGELTQNVPAVTSRSFNALARCGIPLFLLSQSDEEGIFGFTVTSKDVTKAIKSLNEEFAPDMINGNLESIDSQVGKAIVAIVGDDIRKYSGLCARVVNTLDRNNIPVFARSEGSSKTTVTIVIDEEMVNGALPLIHDLFFNN